MEKKQGIEQKVRTSRRDMDTNRKETRKVTFDVGGRKERRKKKRLRKGEIEKECNKLIEEWDIRINGCEERLSVLEIDLRGIRE